jgi:arylsulfatase A-like enzyme
VKKKPNLILFMPETLRADAVLGPKESRARTPVLDRLRERGVSFTNCYCQHTVCSPSRASMFTGLYPHTNGRRSLVSLIKPWDHNLFRDLKEAGYETVCFGKNDLLAEASVPLSFDRWERTHVPEQTGQYSIRYPEGDKWAKTFYNGCSREDGQPYRDRDWADIQSALDFLDEDHEKPFCLFLPLNYAHPPYFVEEPWFSLHDREKIPDPIPADFTGKRSYLELIHRNYGLDKLSIAEIKEIKAVYFGMISRVDHQLGQLLDKLESRGLARDTATLVFSDHGDYTGDFGCTEKWFSAMEDPLSRVPFIAHIPWLEAGGVRDDLIEMVDLFPTVLEIAGVENTHYQFGKSLLPLITGTQEGVHRDAVFCEGGHHVYEHRVHEFWEGHRIYHEKTHLYEHDPLTIAKAWMVRDRRFKYIYCPGVHDELYDMVNDPRETRNLAGDPECAPIITAMRARLLKWFSDTADQVPEHKDPRAFPACRVSKSAQNPTRYP